MFWFFNLTRTPFLYKIIINRIIFVISTILKSFIPIFKCFKSIIRNIFSEIIEIATISPILVYYDLDDLVNDCVTRINFNILFMKRYVDDLVIALSSDKIIPTCTQILRRTLTIYMRRSGNEPFTFPRHEFDERSK